MRKVIVLTGSSLAGEKVLPNGVEIHERNLKD